MDLKIMTKKKKIMMMKTGEDVDMVVMETKEVDTAVVRKTEAAGDQADIAAMMKIMMKKITMTRTMIGIMTKEVAGVRGEAVDVRDAAHAEVLVQ